MKALIGSWDRRPTRELAEVTALRGKIAELEAQLEAARSENDALRLQLLDARALDHGERGVPISVG